MTRSEVTAVASASTRRQTKTLENLSYRIRVQGIELDTELIDEFCLENEKSYQRMQAVRPKK